MLRKVVEIQQNRVVVRIGGQFYMEDASSIRDHLLNLYDEGHVNFTVDLSELDNMDTTGLGVLISLYKRVKAAGGDVVVSGARGNVKQLFELTGMNQVFTVVA